MEKETECNISLNGLSPQQVEDSRLKNGENILTPPKRPSIWKLYFEKYKDPIIQITAAILQAAILTDLLLPI